MSKTVISTNKAPAAIGPYSQAIRVRASEMMFLSGQIPVDPATGQLVEGDVVDQAHQVFRNINAVLDEAGTTTDAIVRTTVFVKSMDDFARVNEVYATYFKEPYPARACVEVARLPKDVLVEIDAIVAFEA